MGDTEHQINAELIKRFKPFYDFNHHSPFETVLELVTSPFRSHGHTGPVDTSGYIHRNYSELSERQVVNRTVFALKKIMTFNHHFFSVEESRVLNPYPSGLINRGVLISSCALNASVAAIMFRNKYFSTASFALFGGLLAAEYVVTRIPNTVNNLLQGPSRKALARKYIEAYGGEFFHEINNPAYDIEKLRHLHNKLSESQGHH